MNERYDYIIVGAGLQGGLLSLALSHHQPDASTLLVEQRDQVGGNHTWSFHQSDIPESANDWLQTVTSSSWPGYSVRFPQLERWVSIPYASIDSRHFGNTVMRLFDSKATNSANKFQPNFRATATDAPEGTTGVGVSTLPDARSSQRPASKLLLNTTIERIDRNQIWIHDTCLTGEVVVDCRGPGRAAIQCNGGCGYQKFYGFEIELAKPWPDDAPIVMDSLADQADGFRFIYSLPFTRDRVLVELTQFSEHTEFSRNASLHEVSAYIAAKTDSEWHIIREECGCLPMPWNRAVTPASTIPLRGGYAGGWFHAATGYSVPLAVRWADAVARSAAHRVLDAVDRLRIEHLSRANQARFLNRLLFRLVQPDRRHEIFQRFYRALPDETIERFYAHRFTPRDLLRILLGRPPSRLTPIQFLKSFAREVMP